MYPEFFFFWEFSQVGFRYFNLFYLSMNSNSDAIFGLPDTDLH